MSRATPRSTRRSGGVGGSPRSACGWVALRRVSSASCSPMRGRAGRGDRRARGARIGAMAEMTLGEAAKAIGVSVDTLRRWDRLGRVWTERDARHRAGDQLSARNRFPGRVVSVEVDGVMALVEIQAGPHRITAAVTRDSVEELDLHEGQRVYARVKATSVMVERDDGAGAA